MDWQGIHEKICMLLPPLRSSAPVIGSAEERELREHTLMTSRRALIDLCRNEASKFLVAGQFELAIPGALQALRFSLKVFGEGAVEIVPAYLLLAEANLGLGRYRQAEEFLSMANWSVLKNPDCSNALRSKLHRNFGKLYASQGKFDKALKELANDIFHSSLEIGPEHIDTAGGYYHMATIFFSQNEINHALAFYDKVVDIWYKFLVGVRQGKEEIDGVSEAAVQEAMAMLKNIAGTRERFLGATHIASGEAQYTVGLLHLYTGELANAKVCVKAAAGVYLEHLGEEHPSTKDVGMVLMEVEEALLSTGETPSNLDSSYAPAAPAGPASDAPADAPAPPQDEAEHKDAAVE